MKGGIKKLTSKETKNSDMYKKLTQELENIKAEKEDIAKRLNELKTEKTQLEKECKRG